jgi:hypothetical protein
LPVLNSEGGTVKTASIFFALLASAAAQASWTTIGSFTWTGGNSGADPPLVRATSAGDLFLANTFAGPPTKVLGATAPYYTDVSKIGAPGIPAWAVQINGAFEIYSMGTDTAGNVLIAGQTPATGFPATPGAWRTASSGPNSSFACKLSGVDGAPIFCTYLNSNLISVVAIAADAAGDVYLFADRNSDPIMPTSGALSLGDRALLLLKLDPTGSRLLYAAEFGGSVREGATSLSVDAGGNAYVMGPTSSPDFPGAAKGAIPTPAPWFVAKIDPTGSNVLHSSYLRAGYTPAAIGLDTPGSLYVTGTEAVSGLSSIFALRFTPSGQGIGYETSVTVPQSGATPGIQSQDVTISIVP